MPGLFNLLETISIICSATDIGGIETTISPILTRPLLMPVFYYQLRPQVTRICFLNQMRIAKRWIEKICVYSLCEPQNEPAPS